MKNKKALWDLPRRVLGRLHHIFRSFIETYALEDILWSRNFQPFRLSKMRFRIEECLSCLFIISSGTHQGLPVVTSFNGCIQLCMVHWYIARPPGWECIHVHWAQWVQCTCLHLISIRYVTASTFLLQNLAEIKYSPQHETNTNSLILVLLKILQQPKVNHKNDHVTSSDMTS